jgi:urease accessory protein
MDRARAAVQELRGTPSGADRRCAGVVGRHARRELAFEARGGRTVLAHDYAEPPFRSSRVFPRGDAAWMICTASAPGAFGGDRLDQIVDVLPGARVVLTSQSALQVHPQGEAPADLRSIYTVGDGADLHCHWDPMIPFAGSRARQRVDIRLEPGAGLFWSDAWLSGRRGFGETWRFAALDHEVRVCRGAELVYLERFRLALGDRDGTGAFAACGHDYLGTVILVRPSAGDAEAERLQREVGTFAGVRVGFDCLEPGLVVGRLMGQDGPAFAAARCAVRQAVRAS